MTIGQRTAVRENDRLGGGPCVIGREVDNQSSVIRFLGVSAAWRNKARKGEKQRESHRFQKGLRTGFQSSSQKSRQR